jgi:1-acyl-sn-glycerol-3-phosphate acyltransferase
MLRGIISNTLFYMNIIVWMILITPVYILPRKLGFNAIKAWAYSALWITKTFAGIDYQVIGRENLPKGGYIVAAKHQSMWETFALVPLFPDAAFILKRELMFIPLFGWLAAKFEMIPVHRGKRSKALKDMAAKAKTEIAKGRQIVIFPEGTRRAVGAPPNYKWGVAYLYSETQAPCVPVALNSGLFWPRRSLKRIPGTITIDILPPIEPGLESEAFLVELQNKIEASCTILNMEHSTYSQ